MSERPRRAELSRAFSADFGGHLFLARCARLSAQSMSFCAFGPLPSQKYPLSMTSRNKSLRLHIRSLLLNCSLASPTEGQIDSLPRSQISQHL